MLTRRPLRYADGKPRPRLRGVLHGVLAAAGVLATAALVWHLRAARCAPRWWPLVGFLLLKTATTTASARFHLVEYASVAAVTEALLVDLLFVPCSAWAPAAILDDFPPGGGGGGRHGAFFAVHGGMLCLFLLNAWLVRRQFRGHAGLDTPKGRSDGPRLAVVTVMSAAGSAVVAAHPGMGRGATGVWAWFAASAALNVAGGACGAVVTAAHAESLCRRGTGWFPWHRPDVWGLHEDMHLLLAASDACMGACLCGLVAGGGGV